MSMPDQKEIAKAYEPGLYEGNIYKSWEESGVFNPDNQTGTQGTYCNVLPPPNANGEMHVGHASGYVIMDLLGRYHRMLGEEVLLLPGKDHAGIQSQVVYEKKIKKERGIDRHDLGREKFYDEVYDFCIDRADYMRSQEKSIGLSADWSREKFTLDPKLVNTVLNTFIRMYNEVDENGNRMIYRGERIINWCPRCATALADVEVEYEEQAAKLYTFKYDKSFPFAISTTRPETKLGDTAVAVNPTDERYQQYVGQTIEADFCGVKLNIKVIADNNVDATFGTGALGVTPAHSQVDWDMGKANGLEEIKVIDQQGKILAGFGEFSGLDVKEAREKIVSSLQDQGLIEKEEDYKNNLSVCERCKTPIEPLISEQWFVDIDHANFSLKKEARRVLENGEIKIYPEKFEKVMYNWIDNVRPWCISRQIWWGPRIPVWYRTKDASRKSKVESQKLDEEFDIYCGREAPEGEGWIQDSDTFDTWFSSGQWAYSTLDYPDGDDFKKFYPSDVMVMGRDILPFWAFRMIILSLYTTRKAPFKNLYFTGLIRDEKGQKMSKSKGNGIEPLDMITKYGTDAVRLSLFIGSAPGSDMNLGEAKIASYRNFTNKLWNVARFIESSYGVDQTLRIDESKLTSADNWILQKFQSLIGGVTNDLAAFSFSQAAEKLQIFTWDDLADWYLEVSKFEKTSEKRAILSYILTDLLKLWHPFIPFVTEAIWREMLRGQMLMTEPWPKVRVTEYESEFSLIQEIVSGIRNARAENKVEPAKKIETVIFAGAKAGLIEMNSETIKGLRTGIEKLVINSQREEIKDAIFIAIGDIEVYLIGATDKEKEKERIEKEIAEKEKFAQALQSKLGNQEFVKNAPAAIVAIERGKLEQCLIELKKLKDKN